MKKSGSLAVSNWEQALRSQAEPTVVPDGLHEAIMNSIRACRKELPAHRDLATPSRPGKAGGGSRFDAFLRWIPAPALGLVILLAYVTTRPDAGSANTAGPLPVASALLVRGVDLTASGPYSLVSPLTDEYRRLDLDLKRTAAFLLSSIP